MERHCCCGGGGAELSIVSGNKEVEIVSSINQWGWAVRLGLQTDAIFTRASELYSTSTVNLLLPPPQHLTSTITTTAYHGALDDRNTETARISYF